jgi:hypothetical protein
LTNRANDTLRFTSVTSLAGTEFSADFDTSAWLEGPFDYTFSIFYTPSDTLTDSISFLIESNGGACRFHITRTGGMSPTGVDGKIARLAGLRIKNYLNPFSFSTTLEFHLESPGNKEIIIFSQSGRVVESISCAGQKGTNLIFWDACNLPAGIYFCRIITPDGSATRKMVLVK